MTGISPDSERSSMIWKGCIILFLICLAPVFLSGLIPPSQWCHGVFPGDGQLNLWALTWQWRSLPTAPDQLWNGNAFYPSPRAICGSDHLFSLVLLGLPFYWVTGNPFTAYHAVLFAGFAIAALGWFYLGRTLFSDRWAALLGACYFTIAIPRTVQAVGHIQIAGFQWLPWSVLGLIRFRKTGGWKDALLFTSALILQLLTSWYLAVFEIVALMILIPCLYIGPGFRSRIIPLLGCLVSAAIVILPFTLPYLSQIPADMNGIVAGSAHWSDYVVPPKGTVLSAVFGAGRDWSEKSVFPGYLIPLFILAGIVIRFSDFGKSEKKPIDSLNQRILAGFFITGCAAWILSLGPGPDNPEGIRLPFHYAATWSNTIAQIRVPARFAQLVVAALAILGGWALARIRQAVKSPHRKLILTVCIFLGLFLEQVPMFRFNPVKTPSLDVYEWIRRQPDSIVIAEVPDYHDTALWSYSAEYMLYAVFHGKKLVNGYSRNVPDGYAERAGWLKAFPDPEALANLKALGVDYVVMHPQKYFYDDIMARFTHAIAHQDRIRTVNELTRLFNEHYASCRSPAGQAAEKEALASGDLELVNRFGRDLVFRIR
jgi:hypothetical protein